MKAIYRFVVITLLAVSIVIFSDIARAGEVPDGFMEIPWGAGTEQIIKAMNERGYRQLKGAPLGQLAFRGAFAGTPCELDFSLIANSFYRGEARVCAESPYPQGPQSAFRRIVDELSKKYGPPQRRDSITRKGNDGKVRPEEHARWDLVDSRTSDKYTIKVDFFVLGLAICQGTIM